MYLCTKFQKVKNKIIDMVFSNKPLQFIIAILFACLPIIGFANTSTDVLPVKSELKDVKTKVLSEAEILKEKIICFLRKLFQEYQLMNGLLKIVYHIKNG